MRKIKNNIKGQMDLFDDFNLSEIERLELDIHKIVTAVNGKTADAISVEEEEQVVEAFISAAEKGELSTLQWALVYYVPTPEDFFESAEGKVLRNFLLGRAHKVSCPNSLQTDEDILQSAFEGFWEGRLEVNLNPSLTDQQKAAMLGGYVLTGTKKFLLKEGLSGQPCNADLKKLSAVTQIAAERGKTATSLFTPVDTGEGESEIIGTIADLTVRPTGVDDDIWEGFLNLPAPLLSDMMAELSGILRERLRPWAWQCFEHCGLRQKETADYAKELYPEWDNLDDKSRDNKLHSIRKGYKAARDMAANILAEWNEKGRYNLSRYFNT